MSHQLTQWSLPTPEELGLNPINHFVEYLLFNCIENTKIKKQRPPLSHYEKCLMIQLLQFQKAPRNCPTCEDSAEDLFKSVSSSKVQSQLFSSEDEDSFDWVDMGRKFAKHFRKLIARIAKILRIGYPPDLVLTS